MPPFSASIRPSFKHDRNQKPHPATRPESAARPSRPLPRPRPPRRPDRQKRQRQIQPLRPAQRRNHSRQRRRFHSETLENRRRCPGNARAGHIRAGLCFAGRRGIAAFSDGLTRSRSEKRRHETGRISCQIGGNRCLQRARPRRQTVKRLGFFPRRTRPAGQILFRRLADAPQSGAGADVSRRFAAVGRTDQPSRFGNRVMAGKPSVRPALHPNHHFARP